MSELTNDEADELIHQGWSSPENTALLKERMDELQARADRAEAAAAEMRGAIIAAISWYGLSAKASDLGEQLNHALSTDSGQGWLSPEKAKAMQDTIDEDVRHLAACSAALAIQQARNQRLETALRPFIEEHYKSAQRTDMGPVEFICTAQMIEEAELAIAANQKAQP